MRYGAVFHFNNTLWQRIVEMQSGVIMTDAYSRFIEKGFYVIADKARAQNCWRGWKHNQKFLPIWRGPTVKVILVMFHRGCNLPPIGIVVGIQNAIGFGRPRLFAPSLQLFCNGSGGGYRTKRGDTQRMISVLIFQDLPVIVGLQQRCVAVQ